MYDFNNTKKLIILIFIVILALLFIYILKSFNSSDIIYSHKGNIYSKKIKLKLKTGNNRTIYYTTDASIPTVNSKKYSEPIDIVINETNPTIINSISCLKNNCSKVKSEIYFVGIKLGNKEFPILSLITDPNNLYDSKTGIFKNYMEEGDEWEIPVTLKYFYNNKIFSQKLGLNISGASNRNPYKNATFSLHARKKYDNKGKIDIPLLSSKELNSISLRQRYFDYTGFLENLVEDRNVSTQEYRKVNLYINNEFFGIFSLMERYDSHYFKIHENLNEDYLAIVKGGVYEVGSIKSENDDYSYSNMINYLISKDLSISENYEYFASIVNIQSLIDYYCTRIYINDVDFDIYKNNLIWKSYYGNNQNNKWSWALFDLDASISTDWIEHIDYTFNTFAGDFPYAHDIKEDVYLNNLMVNKEFRKLFIKTFIEIAKENFDIDIVTKKIEKLEKSSIDEFNELDKETIITFFEKRSNYIVPYMYDYVRSFK